MAGLSGSCFKRTGCSVVSMSDIRNMGEGSSCFDKLVALPWFLLYLRECSWVTFAYTFVPHSWQSFLMWKRNRLVKNTYSKEYISIATCLNILVEIQTMLVHYYYAFFMNHQLLGMLTFFARFWLLKKSETLKGN